jgi:CheY-like chemotaxis protein
VGGSWVMLDMEEHTSSPYVRPVEVDASVLPLILDQTHLVRERIDSVEGRVFQENPLASSVATFRSRAATWSALMTSTRIRHGLVGVERAVPSALAALNFLAKQGRDRGMPTPDLIVSDLNMPMISGLEFLQLLKQSEWSHIPVLIQTTSSSPAERSTAMGLGAVDFWTKEPLWDDFVKQLTKLVTYLSQDGVEGRAGSEGA